MTTEMNFFAQTLESELGSDFRKNLVRGLDAPFLDGVFAFFDSLDETRFFLLVSHNDKTAILRNRKRERRIEPDTFLTVYIDDFRGRSLSVAHASGSAIWRF